MAEVRWTQQSIEDIENIAAYISKDSKKYAVIQVQEFFEAATILESYPRAGRIVPEVGDKNIRELIIGSYRLIYRAKDLELIEILTVYHSRRILKPRTIKRRG